MVNKIYSPGDKQDLCIVVRRDQNIIGSKLS